MRIIQSLNDLEYLKALNIYSPWMLAKVEADFHLFYDVVGEGENILSFHLPMHQSLRIVEREEEVKTILKPWLCEDVHVYEDVFVLTVRNDDVLQSYYVPYGTVSESMENLLRNLGRMNSERNTGDV